MAVSDFLYPPGRTDVGLICLAVQMWICGGANQHADNLKLSDQTLLFKLFVLHYQLLNKNAS